jgi:hypothetical protein
MMLPARRPEIILRGHYLPTTTLDTYLSVKKSLVLDGLLKNGDFGSSGFISDSGGEVELLPPEELEVLTANHERLRNELQAMREAFERQTKGRSLSD